MKLPAYGKQLLRSRRAGLHPAAVTVVYGEDWYVPKAEFRLAVKPGEALERDWTCVAGLPVEFINRSDDAMFVMKDGEGLRLVAEIAREAADVVIEEDGERMSAYALAFLKRGWTPRPQWPAWWSEEIEKIHGQNYRRWLQETEAYLAQLAA